MEPIARDFARIGLLMPNKGVWDKRRIISAKWVEQSTKPSQNLNPATVCCGGYMKIPPVSGAQG